MQQAVKPKPRRKYDIDFKAEVLKMLISGQSAAYIAKALGISENLIYTWKSKNQGGKKATTQQPELAAENQQLKERVRQLETERGILKMPGRRPCWAFSAGRPDTTLRPDRGVSQGVFCRSTLLRFGCEPQCLLSLSTGSELPAISEQTAAAATC